ncbi:MAG: aspartyl/asparaginyl beta-hydroxylase domain-containing protein [Bacteroidia bacterium]
MQKAWYNIYNVDSSYNGSEPSFADPSEFPWTKEFEDNYEAIYAELKEYLKAHNLIGYFIKSMVSRENSWKTIPLRTWGIQQFKNQKHFPLTYSIIRKYPQILSSSFNLLEANSAIHPHCGDTNTIYRCHLGLEIPGGAPECAFRVRNEIRAWEKGKWLMFMDAYEHEAINNTDKNRYIFVVDVIRDEFRSRKKRTCATVMTSLFLQKRWQKHTFLKKLSPGSVRLIAILLRPMSRSAIFFSNFFKRY